MTIRAIVLTDPGSNAPNTAQLPAICCMSCCSVKTPAKFTPEARPRRVGPKRRGRARESGSRYVDMGDHWTFQCDETTPKPDRPRPHLGRNRQSGACLHMDQYVSRTLECQSCMPVTIVVRRNVFGHSARNDVRRVNDSVSDYSKSRRFFLKHIHLKHIRG